MNKNKNFVGINVIPYHREGVEFYYYMKFKNDSCTETISASITGDDAYKIIELLELKPSIETDFHLHSFFYS